MPLTMYARDAMLDELASQITHIGLFEDGTPIGSVTGAASTDTFTLNGHGLTDGTLVFLSDLMGGNGLVEGRPYFVVNSAANTFQLSHYPGGDPVNFTTDVSDVTVTPSEELAGGNYSREEINYDSAADGVIDDTDNGIDITVPSGATVNRAGYFDASTSGNLLAVTKQTPEGPYGAEGIYRVTDSKINLNAAGAN